MRIPPNRHPRLPSISPPATLADWIRDCWFDISQCRIGTLCSWLHVAIRNDSRYGLPLLTAGIRHSSTLRLRYSPLTSAFIGATGSAPLAYCSARPARHIMPLSPSHGPASTTATSLASALHERRASVCEAVPQHLPHNAHNYGVRAPPPPAPPAVHPLWGPPRPVVAAVPPIPAAWFYSL